MKKHAKPRKPATPEGRFTTSQILALAKSRGLPVGRTQITEKLERMREGREPWPEGISQSRFGVRQKYFFPRKFVDELLADARHKKNLPRHLEKERHVPLSALAKELGLKDVALLRHQKLGNLTAFMVGKKYYTTRREASRFRRWYGENVAGTLSSRGGKARRGAKKTSKPKVDWRTRQEAEWRLENIVKKVKNKSKRRLMERLIAANMGLPHKEFMQKVVGKMDRMLATKKK